MAARDSRTRLGTSVLGAIGTSLDRPHESHRRLPQHLLPLCLVAVGRTGLQEPILRDLVEEIRHALALGAGGFFELGLETRR